MKATVNDQRRIVMQRCLQMLMISGLHPGNRKSRIKRLRHDRASAIEFHHRMSRLWQEFCTLIAQAVTVFLQTPCATT